MDPISTNGISPSQVIRAEHVLRIINALSNVSENAILISGSLIVTGSTSLSGSLNVGGGITGSFFGTSSNATSASYATNASTSTSSSYALTASYAVSASYEINYETSSSYAENATSASYSLSSSYALDSTNATNSTSASYALDSTNSTNATSASYALDSTNAAVATSASYSTVAQTLLGSVVSASYADNALSSSYALNSTNAASATSASYSLNSTNAASATSASYALDSTNATAATSASYALTASYALNSPGGGGTTDTGSLLLTASVDSNVITFTKGDASTFNITVDTGSASSIDTGSFATTGSNQFSGSQGITGSIDLDGGTFTTLGGGSLMNVYSNIITIENQGSPFDTTLLGQGTLSYIIGSDTQHFLFPASLTGGTKTITLPNDTGTVALTYNTAITGSNTFTGNQIINANLTLTSSATMSILTTGGNSGMQITKDQILINPNLNSDRATLSGGSLSLSDSNGYSGLYLTNRNGSNDTSSIEIHRMQFYGKDTDTYNGLKAGLRVYQSVGTGSSGHINFYTSASSAFGFSTGDIDMRISTGSKIELFRDTTVTGSLNIKGDVNISSSKQVFIEGDTNKTSLTSTGVSINTGETRAKATLSPGVLDVTGRPGAAEVILRNDNALDDTTFDAGQISFYGSSDSNAYGGVQGKIQARVDSGSGVVASYLEFYTSGNGGFPFDTTDVDMRISTGSKIELFRNTTLTGSLNVSGSSTFRGNQTVNGNLALTSSATMSILTTGGSTGMAITRDQVSINPNLNSNRALLYGGNLQLSSANGYNVIYLTNRNGSSDTGSIEIGRMQFQGKETDANFGLKAGLRVLQSVGTGSSGYINFYTSASAGYGFTSGDIDMRISTGSKIELFRDTTVTGSVSITSVLTLAPNDPLPTSQPTGSISVSGSGADCKPYFYNGTDWTSMI